MIDRAIYLKDALTLYQDHADVASTIPEEQRLDRQDWEELADLKDLLAPIYEVSMQV